MEKWTHGHGQLDVENWTVKYKIGYPIYSVENSQMVTLFDFLTFNVFQWNLMCSAYGLAHLIANWKTLSQKGYTFNLVN